MIRTPVIRRYHPAQPVFACLFGIRRCRIHRVAADDRLRWALRIVTRTPMAVNVGVTCKPFAPGRLRECDSDCKNQKRKDGEALPRSIHNDPSLLEQQLQCELNLSCGVGARDAAETATGAIAVWR